jgi:hypothetical protein
VHHQGQSGEYEQTGEKVKDEMKKFLHMLIFSPTPLSPVN